MLRSTFVHLTGIGLETEVTLWRRGVFDWETFALRELPRFPESRRSVLARELTGSARALADRAAEFFARRLPANELWRIYPDFRRETAFLDIETTGLSPYDGAVTVVTIHGGGATRTFVADDDLEELPAYLGRFSALVTFNGRLFDVPFLEYRFPGLSTPIAHIDLRFVLYRLGISGGLKRIEAFLNLGDRTGVEGVSGLDAVRLWEEFRRGRTESLEKLIRYNRADTVNLEPLLEFATRELETRLLARSRREERVSVTGPRSIPRPAGAAAADLR